MAGILARMVREGYRFDFYQAVRLLEQQYAEAPAPGTTSDVRRERIRFRPHNAMSFPATDVQGIEQEEGTHPHTLVTATFLGLYGVDAPLPQAFFEPITLERDGEAMRSFLDLFNHRFYSYFYRAWKKYRPELHHRADETDAHTRRLVALAGLGTPSAASAPVASTRLAAFAGFLAPRARGAEGLRRLVEDLLDGAPIRVVENVARWVSVPQTAQLGRAPGVQLGSSAVVGRRVRDVAGLFRLQIGPLDLPTYLDLLPGKPRAQTLQRLVRLYASDHLDFDVELHLAAPEVPRARLSDDRVMLGLTACLGTPKHTELRRVVHYADAAFSSN